MNAAVLLVVPDQVRQFVTARVAARAEALADLLRNSAAQASDVRIEPSGDAFLVIGRASLGMGAEFGSRRHPPQLTVTQAIARLATGEAP